MADDPDDATGPTRRRYLALGGSVLASGVLAGCAGEAAEETTTASGADGASATSATARPPPASSAVQPADVVDVASMSLGRHASAGPDEEPPRPPEPVPVAGRNRALFILGFPKSS